MTLAELNIGERAVITKVRGRGAFRKRIIEMGFIVGKEITVIKKAPMNDPIEYNVMSYNVTLRNSEAQLIEIVTYKDFKSLKDKVYNGVFDGELLTQKAKSVNKIINVALVGNPNCGKTTIFNHASGLKERVGNYGGVTVEAKEAHFKQSGYIFKIVDLPGTYSLSAYSPEELFVRDHIVENVPDIVVNVIDSSNLERNLYLTTQLIDMDIRVIVVLNMFDELENSGDHFDYELFGKMVGIPIVPTIGSKGKGIYELFNKIIKVYEDKEPTVRHIHIHFGNVIESGIRAIQAKIRIPANIHVTAKISSRFLAIKLLEKDALAVQRALECVNSSEINETCMREIIRIETALQEDTETAISDAKYGFISGALKETYKAVKIKKRRKSDKIDDIITHKWWGIPIFIFFMWLTFFFTFKIGQYPMVWIEDLVQLISFHLSQNINDGIFKDLLIDGIIGGVGGVVVFLPNILLLYFFISLLEDTGYMARAVFIMDKTMHKIGLHGKSFIPLIMGFGCNVPAILATRIIESRRDRLITMLINPFMSCSARLPVYILFISAFFVSYQGTILFLIYGIGILLAIGSALIFKRSFFTKEDIPFVMELPPYRMPTFRTLLRHMWYKGEQYLRKIAGVILIASIIIWALGYFPREMNFPESTKTEFPVQNSLKESQLNAHLHNKSTDVGVITNENYEQLKQENSYIGRLGKAIEPLMAPLGFDWRMTMGIITGVAAKEIVVSTLGVLYQVENTNESADGTSLVTKLQNQVYFDGPKKGEKVFTPLVAFSFMLFILIYFPCIGVIAAIRKESGTWKWALFSVVYTSVLAWLFSFATYQIGSLFF